jgi:hypothetical protein
MADPRRQLPSEPQLPYTQKGRRRVRAHAQTRTAVTQNAAADTLYHPVGHSVVAGLQVTARGVIADPARRDKYLQYSESLESELLAFERYAADFIDDYRLAFKDHGTQQAELRTLSAAFRERQREMQDRWVELHLAMAATVTAEEWQPLSKIEARIIESLLAATPGSTR